MYDKLTFCCKKKYDDLAEECLIILVVGHDHIDGYCVSYYLYEKSAGVSVATCTAIWHFGLCNMAS